MASDRAEFALSSFTGLNVVVVQPTVMKIVRSWRERLFSRPWRPWSRTKIMIVTEAVATDASYQIGGTLYCGERFYQRLKEASDVQP